MFKDIFKLLLLLFVVTGCSVKPVKVPESQVKALAFMLQGLDGNIKQEDALLLSRDLFRETAHLVKAFNLTSPPWFHNTLVNTGFRKKGLCYDWSDALYVHVVKQGYSEFDFHLGGANIGEYWREHNVLVVTAKGKPFDSGVVIDPWRDSGKLYFEKVKKDRQYSWKERKDRCVQ